MKYHSEMWEPNDMKKFWSVPRGFTDCEQVMEDDQGGK